MNEVDRDLHAVWRFIAFLRRAGHDLWTHDQLATLVGDYSRDRTVQDEIRAWRYHEIDGLSPVHHQGRQRRKPKGQKERCDDPVTDAYPPDPRRGAA